MDRFRKAKNNYIYSLHGEKWFDLSTNSNIIGHSHRLMTTLPKNALSASWTLKGPSVYHARFESLMEKLFPSYKVFFTHSYIEFLLLFYNKNTTPTINTDETCCLAAKFGWPEPYTCRFIIYDMQEIYLKKQKVDHYENNILNYLWYPKLEIDTHNASVVILPELYSGYTDKCFVLVKNDFVKQFSWLGNINEINSFDLICAMKLYYTIKKIQAKQHKTYIIKNENVLQRGRIWTFKENYQQCCQKLRECGILLNEKIPYNYLPITLEDYQIKYLNKIFSQIL